MLRPLTLLELIERQIAYADFSVDGAAIDVLRLKHSLARILSDSAVVGEHPELDWRMEVEHVFADSLAAAARALVNSDDRGERVLRFDEFRVQPDHDRCQPFPRLLEGFIIKAKPILWLRLVAYANACNTFAIRMGAPLGLEQQPLDVAWLLSCSADPYVNAHTDDYFRRVTEAALLPLGTR